VAPGGVLPLTFKPHDRSCQLAQGVVSRLSRQRRAEPRERVTQLLCERHLPVVVALRAIAAPFQTEQPAL